MQTIPTFSAFITLALILIAFLLVGATICLTVYVVKQNVKFVKFQTEQADQNSEIWKTFSFHKIGLIRHDKDFISSEKNQTALEERVAELEAILKIVTSTVKQRLEENATTSATSDTSDQPTKKHPTPCNAPRPTDDIFSAWANIFNARAS